MAAEMTGLRLKPPYREAITSLRRKDLPPRVMASPLNSAKRLLDTTTKNSRAGADTPTHLSLPGVVRIAGVPRTAAAAAPEAGGSTGEEPQEARAVAAAPITRTRRNEKMETVRSVANANAPVVEGAAVTKADMETPVTEAGMAT